MTQPNLVEVARNFSYKLNLGNYQTADFFCSQKAEVKPEEVDKKSEELFDFCYVEVMRSIRKYRDNVSLKDLADWNEKKQKLYEQDSKLEEVKLENIKL